MSHFSQTLQEEMRKAGLTSYELARRMNRDESFVKRLPKGTRNPSLVTVFQVALALVADPKRFEEAPEEVVNTFDRLRDAFLEDAMDAF